MISLIEGGHFQKKGYYYKLYLTLPEFKSSNTINMFKNKHRVTKISFPTCFLLTRNNIYVNIVIRVLGFGLGLEIQSKS
jgi:hypothetical protein